MEQVLAPLLDEMNAMREKMDSNREEMKTTPPPKMMDATMEAKQEKMDAWLKNEGLATKDVGLPRSNGGLSKKTKAGLKEIKATVNIFEEMLGKMDTTDFEAN
jgi:hypothetical protein